MPAYRRYPVRSTAFTLLELILVMIILCTVLAMAAPSLKGFFSSRQLNDISEQILTMTRYAKVQSVCQSKPYRVNFDPNLRRYWISSQSESQYAPLGNNFGNYFPVPTEIEMVFEDVQNENGIYYFQFDPEGYSKAARLRLRDNQNNVVDIVCNSPPENYEIIKVVNEYK